MHAHMCLNMNAPAATHLEPELVVTSADVRLTTAPVVISCPSVKPLRPYTAPFTRPSERTSQFSRMGRLLSGGGVRSRSLAYGRLPAAGAAPWPGRRAGFAPPCPGLRGCRGGEGRKRGQKAQWGKHWGREKAQWVAAHHLHG